MLRFVRDLPVNRQSMKDAIVKDKSPLYEGKDMRDIWETHEMEPEMARAFTAAMHTRSLHLGVAMAQRIDF